MTSASLRWCTCDRSRWNGVGSILSIGRIASSRGFLPSGSLYWPTRIPPSPSIRFSSSSGTASSRHSAGAKPRDPAFCLRGRRFAGARFKPVFAMYYCPSNLILLYPMIDLYAAGTSNGMRARIALEECGLSYNWHPIDLMKGEHKKPEFLALNPMGQIPVLVDSEGPGGKKVTMAQSSAIMMYCAEKAGKFIPKDGAKRAAMLEAYMSASTDITPMFGSVNACVRAKDPA